MFNLTFLLVIFLAAPTFARSVPTPPGKSSFVGTIIRNIDEYNPHWGGNIGYNWQGRADLRLDYNGDGFPGEKRMSLQAEFALVKHKDFILELGYHHELSSENSQRLPWRRPSNINLIPARITFPLKVGSHLHILPNLTYWHILKEGYGIIGFVGLEFLVNRRYAFGLELNVNQDFRFHDLDFRLGIYW